MFTASHSRILLLFATVHPPSLVRGSMFAFILFPVPALAEVPLTPEQAAVAMVEAPLLDDVAISPDGKWVTYAVTRPSVEKNTRGRKRYLLRVPQNEEGVKEATVLNLPDGAVGVQWRADSKCLSMIVGGAAYDYGRETPKANTSFVCYDIANEETKIIPVDGPAVTANYKWSPSGNYVAFLAPLTERAPLDPASGVPYGLVEPGQFMALFVLNVKTGTVEQLTSDSVNVARSPATNFAWSPDERSLAVALDREMQSWGFNTELAVIDRRNRHMQTLTTRPGMNGRPCWSPDGHMIAFATHQGDPAYRSGWPALIPARGGEVIDFPQDSPLGFLDCRWIADGRAFYYVSSLAMTRALVRADIAGRQAQAVPGASNQPRVLEDNRSFSADRRMMAFTRESLTAPPELFVIALDKEGKAKGEPIQLTHFAKDFTLGTDVRVEEISWPSRDGQFTIHGLLLMPASAQGKLPTVIYLWGGPSMVRRGFIWWHGAYLPLAARGYAVLVPNTRGRGGYGAEFQGAISTGKSRGRLPLDDALAGLDHLIAHGIADSERTGVHGFSYGGYLAAYAITQIHDLKAAVIQDGVSLNLLTNEINCNSDGWQSWLCADLFGVHNPFDPDERARMIEESPALNADRICTPTLLLSAKANRDLLSFYHALRRFDVPSALLVYDEGHVFKRPAAIADSLTRAGEWFDYWIRDIHFPDPVRAKEFDIDEWGKAGH